MRLPALSYAVESVLGAAAVILAVVVVFPDPPPRARPAAAAGEKEPPPRPAPAQALVPPVRDDTQAVAAAEAQRTAAVLKWTNQIDERGGRLTVNPARRTAVWNAHLEAIRAETVGAFDATPGRDAPWAAHARAALDAHARLLVTRQLTHQFPEQLLVEEESALVRAVAAGCDDPLVGYWHARSATREGATDPDRFRAAVERMADSTYPPPRRLAAVLGWLTAAQRLRPSHPLRADVGEWETRFWELFEASARLRTLVVDEDLLDVAVHWQTYRRAQGVARDQMLAELDRHVRRGGGRDYLRRTLRGEGLLYRAWDDRGPDGDREEFDAHLAEAHQLLLDAMEADPSGYSAPTRLLSVCTGLGAGRDEVDDVFRRAMHANPDNFPACFTMLDYVHPRWRGDADGSDYLECCWELALYPGDGWVQRAVLANLFSHHPVGGPQFDTDPRVATRYYQSDDVFDLVWTTCRALEAARPGDGYAVNVMARIACVAERYEVARQYFSRVGGLPHPGVFASPAEFDHFRRQAGLTP